MKLPGIKKRVGPALSRENMLSDFQSRYVMPFAVFVLAAFILFSLCMITSSRGKLVDRTEKEQIKSALLTAQGLEQAFGVASDLLASISKSNVSTTEDPRKAVPLLKSYIKHLDQLSSIYIMDTGGNVLASTDAEDSRGSSIINDECYDRMTRQAEVCYSNISVESDGYYVSYLYTPVFDKNGDLFRMVVGSVNVSKNPFKSMVMGANPGQHGFALLADRNGALVLIGDPAYKNTGDLGNVLHLTGVKQALAGDKGAVKMKYAGQNMFASYTQVQGPNWALIMMRPASELGGVTGLVLLAILFAILGTVGAVAISVLQSQSVTRFLFQLGGRLDSLTNGSLDLDISAAEEDSEMSQLSMTFNNMLKKVRRERKQNEATLQEAMDTAKFSQSVMESMKDPLLVVGTELDVKTANDAAASLCGMHATAMAGRPLSGLGSLWSQSAVDQAVKKALRENKVSSVSDIHLPTDTASDGPLELRVYPLHKTTSSYSDGAVIYGFRMNPEISTLISENKDKIGTLTASTERLKRSEKYFREMIRDFNDGLLILDRQGRVEWSNPAAQKILHCDYEGSQKLNFKDLVAAGSKNFFDKGADRVLDTGQYMPPFELQLEVEREKKIVEASLSRAAAGTDKFKLVVLMRAVPAQRMTERATGREAVRDRDRLEKRIAFLNSVFNSAPMALALTDNVGRIIEVNKQFEKLFKNRREVFLGKTITTLHDGKTKFVNLSSANHLGLQRVESRMKTLSGGEFLAEAWAAPLPAEGGDRATVLCAFREIGSERAAAEREKRRLRETTVNTISRDIAQRLYVPVTGMVKSLQELGGNIFSDENRNIWWNAMRGGKALNQSVNMMLLFANEQPLKTTICKLDALVQETIEALEQHNMIPDHISLTAETAGEVPVCEADGEQMKLVMWNLILNALQAVEKADDAEVQVKVFARDINGEKKVIVDIMDTGPDFPSAEVDKFFQPFYGRREDGVGLGLPLCRRVLERHGGRLGMERKTGYTRVSFAVPLRAKIPSGGQAVSSAFSSRTLN